MCAMCGNKFVPLQKTWTVTHHGYWICTDCAVVLAQEVIEYHKNQGKDWAIEKDGRIVCR
jgi:hypothetical protein